MVCWVCLDVVDVPDVILTLTGQSFTASQGEAFNPVVIEGVSASFSVGSITPRDQTQGLSADAITAVLGTPTVADMVVCLLYTSPSPRDGLLSRMPSSA